MYSNFKSKIYGFFLYLWIVYSKIYHILTFSGRPDGLFDDQISLLNVMFQQNIYILLLKSLNIAYHQVFFLLLEIEILLAMMNSRIFPSSESSENKTIAAQ